MSDSLNDKIHVRWMIRRDMPQVIDIERRSFEYPWNEDDYVHCLRHRNCIGMVAEADGALVVGVFIYVLTATQIRVLNFAVHPEWRRIGVGLRMADKLKGKLQAGRRTRIVLEVRESNIPAQLFFASQGFRAVNVIRNFYHDCPLESDRIDEDAYVMQYRLPNPQAKEKAGV